MLTGQLFVDLVMQPKAPLKRGEKNELPTVRGVGMEQIMASAGSIMEQLGRVDYAALGADLQGTLKGVNVMVNGPHLNTALEELATTLKSVRVLLGALEGRAEPIADNLERTLVAAREALEKAKSTMALVDGAIAPEAPLHHHAVRLAQELTITTRSLRHLVETLERNPQALLLGKPVASEKESR
jgi:paraquat-inducible protein B